MIERLSRSCFNGVNHNFIQFVSSKYSSVDRVKLHEIMNSQLLKDSGRH